MVCESCTEYFQWKIIGRHCHVQHIHPWVKQTTIRSEVNTDKVHDKQVCEEQEDIIQSESSVADNIMLGKGLPLSLGGAEVWDTIKQNITDSNLTHRTRIASSTKSFPFVPPFSASTPQPISLVPHPSTYYTTLRHPIIYSRPLVPPSLAIQHCFQGLDS